MTRSIFLLFGIVAYVIFFGTFLYLVGFLADVPALSHTVDRGPASPVAAALAVDVALISAFGLQHSIMARQGFKKAWTRFVPAVIERSTYVIFSSLALILLFACWRPLPHTVWHVENSFGALALWMIFGLGWLVVLLSTFLISHFELFGLKQVWLNMRGGLAEAPKFRQPFFYKLVRHPLYAGFFLAFWATPVMTVGHLFLAVGMSVYMLVAIRYEERDLVGLFGKDYESYRKKTGMLLPKVAKGN
jgi:methanethiol S-methyltransferase